MLASEILQRHYGGVYRLGSTGQVVILHSATIGQRKVFLHTDKGEIVTSVGDTLDVIA